MSSDLLVFGCWRFVRGGEATFQAASLSYPAHEHDEESLAGAFAGTPTGRVTSVRMALARARSVGHFAKIELDGDVLRVQLQDVRSPTTLRLQAA